jgi:hypothetical protein
MDNPLDVVEATVFQDDHLGGDMILRLEWHTGEYLVNLEQPPKAIAEILRDVANDMDATADD